MTQPPNRRFEEFWRKWADDVQDDLRGMARKRSVPYLIEMYPRRPEDLYTTDMIVPNQMGMKFTCGS